MTQLFDIINPLHHALDYHTERHNLIASNVANADTPGYRPREITFDQAFGEINTTVSVEQTREGHLRAPGQSDPSGFQVYEETWATPGADGNYVRMEHEMSRMQANTVRYRATTQMVSHHLGMLRYAIASKK